ncbi:MAG: hypothetical protein M3P34_01195 [Actinomycetota bacterium]|nr:hypothetical protein [Actinomycetota bacterium]
MDELGTAGEGFAAVFGYDGHGWVKAANLLRLAGDKERSVEWLERALLLFAESSSRRFDWINQGMQIEGLFLLGRDADAREVCDRIMAETRSRGVKLRLPIVADLADARRMGDAQVCAAVIDWFDRKIKGERVSPVGITGFGLHDWLELALITYSQITGQTSPRLKEI